MRFALIPLFCALCACQSEPSSGPAQTPSADVPAAAQAPAADSSFVLPGTFSQRTTVAELEARFGRSNVTVSEVREDDGTLVRSVVLFADDPTRRAFVDFHDDATLSGVRSITVGDAGSRWRGKHGVHVGMSFAELRERNGKPFWFSGFDSAHRGRVQDQWSPAIDDDAGLGTLDVEEGDHMYFGVELGLRGDATTLSDDAYPRDDSISSDDPRYPRLGELVVVTAINATTSLDDEWE